MRIYLGCFGVEPLCRRDIGFGLGGVMNDVDGGGSK